MYYQFPENFTWGVATAAAQIEGGANEDGRGLSIWDVFSRIPGSIKHGGVPEVACDSYHRYERDVEMLKELGVNSYRFSFSWSRIMPDGTGKVNEAGIAYYKNLIALLRENGIKPNATMYHWDLPYQLQLKGGFGNREIVKWFTEYARVLLDNFGEDVDFWVTFNEPIATYVGYSQGFFAPGLHDEKYARQALHNLLICHGEVVKLFRTYGFMNSKIGIVVDVWKHYPANPGKEEDEKLVIENNEIKGFGMFLNPLFLGGYSEVLMEYFEKNGLTPDIQDGDFETINQPLDFYGLNFYNGLYDDAVKLKEQEEAKKQGGGNYQDRPESHPEAVCDVLHMLVDKYKINIPIYITENGFPYDNADGKEANMNDDLRIDYVKQVLKWAHKAIEEGIDLRGYYLWSLMDNFEWSAGYCARYGVYYTDYETLECSPKKSAKWYSAVTRDNGFEE
ncbi:glycoside hydrolase family 1 protein [Bilifractor sp. HCP3S3_D3]|uniref:glycoside hydrolase family 1 protein n=1 Tax=Bilifractor sp. HCP3S3_D3 TaxID=3438907 RepID=UPI003F8ADD5F